MTPPVEEITAAIEQLPADEVGRLRASLADYAVRLWGEPIERNERAGGRDTVIDQAPGEHCRTKPFASCTLGFARRDQVGRSGTRYPGGQ
jgi:hypothetical protein